MVDYPIIRFVAEAGSTTARLDLNDGAKWTTDHEGFSLGAPEYDVDPYAVGALYGLREVTISPRVKGGPSAAFPELSKLSVEIMRSRNWLMFQYDADSEPFWLRTYRAAPQAINLDDVYIDDDTSEWLKPVTLKAEAFARGQKVTLPAVTIVNNPAAASGNKASYVLPAIEGDAPAPLSVLVEGATTTIDALKAPLIAMSAVEQSYTPPLVVTNWTYPVLNGEPHEVTNASYVAGKYVVVGTGSAVDGAALTATVTPPFAGRYKAYLRVGFSDTGSEWDFTWRRGGRVRVTQRALGNDASEPWIWWGSAGTQGWIDMGTVALGSGWSELLNPTLETDVTLDIVRLNGTGTVRVDSVLFVPMDDNEQRTEARTLKVDPYITPSSADIKFHADSENRQLWGAYDSGSGLRVAEYGGLSGRFPQVVPGRTNVLHLLRNIDTGADVKTNTTTVTMSYFPRRLDPLGV